MSYLTAQANEIPSPNGTLTTAQLSAQLNSTTAPFCGKITTNCVNVVVNNAPDDIEETVEICAPSCYVFNGIPRCVSGTYTATLLQNGCPYTSTLNLTVNSPITVNLLEQVCEGDCSTNPAFPDACTPGLHQVTLQRTNGCDSIVRLTLQTIAVQAATGPLPSVPCSGNSVSLQGIGSTTGAGVVYTWTASNGGNITGPTNTVNTTINAAGDYQLRVCRTSGLKTCCDSVQVSITSQTDPPPSPAQIFGNSNFCQGQSFNYNVAPVPGATSYTWDVPSGVTVNSSGTGPTVNLTWGIPDPGQICVSANNACGTSAPTCLNVNVNATPVAPIPTGIDTVCVGETSTYSIPELTNATGIIWTVTPPNIINSGQGTNSIEVSWVGGTTANVCVRAGNACGISPLACKPVVIGTLPISPVISGNPNVCAGSTSNYAVAPVPGATSYTWTITGGTITGGNNTTLAIITWNPGATTGSVCVTANNAICGSSQPSCFNVNLSPLPTAPIISGQANLCAGTTATYTATTIPGATNYTWTVPAGATITAGQGTTSITVNWGAGSAPGGNICVSVGASCGSSPQICFPVTVSAVPVANAGSDQQVCATTATLSANTGVGSGQWTTLNGPGTAVFSNPTAANSTVTVSTHGTYTFRWMLSNATCTDDDDVEMVFSSDPAAGAIQPACDPTNENYTISFPITGGTPPYTVPNGTVANGVFTSNSIVNAATYSFQITDSRGCQSPVITGSFNCNCATNAGTMNQTQLTACAGQTISAQHNNNATLDANDIGAYVLHAGGGTALVSPIATNSTGVFGFQAGMVFGQTYYVSYVVGNNVNGTPSASDPCRSVAQGQPVVFYDNPTANAGVDQATCGLTLDLAATSNAGPGIWSVSTNIPNGATLNISNQTSATSSVTASAYGTYTLVWTVNNNGCTDTDEVDATFNDSPVAGQITDNCNNTNTQYTVTIPINGGQAPYSVNNTVITGNTYISSLIPSSTPYSFIISDAKGCTSAPISGLVNCNCTTSAGNMSLTPLSACVGDSITAQHIAGTENLDGDDVTIYVLHEGGGTNIVNPVATNSTGIFKHQSGMTFGQTYYVSLVAGSALAGAPNPADPCISVAQGQPVIFFDNPVANPGPAQAVCGQSLQLAAIGTGQWTVVNSPVGGTLQLADPTNPTTDATANVFGIYTLRWSVNANGCSDDATVTADFNQNPSLANLVRTCDAANENFNVIITLSDGQAPYEVNGAAIAGTQFTSPPLPNGQPYAYSIADANGCELVVTGAFSCNCATSPGTMSVATLTACEGTTVTATANNDATLDGNDVTAYVLHTGSGPALGTVIAQNTSGTFGFVDATMDYGVTYYVSRIAGNPLGGQPNPADPCFGVAPGQPVVFQQNPQPTAGVDQTVCGTTATLAAVTGSFDGMWQMLNGAGTITFSSATAQNSTITASVSGIYNLVWTEMNGQCAGADTVRVTLRDVPVVSSVDETCNSTNTAYTVTLNVTGGTAPYTASGLGGTFTGNSFASVPVASTTTYNIVVTDANGCTSGPLSGSKNCNCATDAGSMITTPAIFCANSPATATWNNDGTLDGDDINGFVLHTQAGSTLGQVLATSNTASFAFGAGLQVNTTYYISAVAGNGLPNGQIDINDDCLSVAPGTPVRWKPMPTATMTGANTICAGESATLTFSGTGTFPLTLSYAFVGGTNTLTLNTASDVLQVSPLNTTNYVLTGVTDGTLPSCSVSLSQNVNIIVNQPVEAGTAVQSAELCAGSGTPVPLSNLLTNTQNGGTWQAVTQVPAGALNPNTGALQTTNMTAGTYEFKYQISATAPCPSDEVSVSVEIHPIPIADAGTDQEIDCIVQEAQLGGSGTTNGAGVSYDWTLNNTALPDTSKQITTTLEGTYNLLVTNQFGCTATDQVIVDVNNELPTVGTVQVNDVRCFGENNGSIAIAQIEGGQAPYRVSLNDGAFFETNLLGQLSPGTYEITVQDANGCETVVSDLVVDQPPMISVDLGEDLQLRLGDSAFVELVLNVPLTQLDSILWEPLLDPAGAGTPFQRYMPVRTENLRATVVDTNGCRGEARLYVFLDRTRNIYVPNIFDPNGQDNNVVTVYGGNDVFEIEYFRIYDRWGSLMHQANSFLPGDESKGWRGGYGDNGQVVQPAVFVWMAAVRFKDGEIELFSGDVTVYR
jgi:hypothetical protein